MAAGSLALMSSCQADAPESVPAPGRIELALSAELEGVVYRLSATFDVTGAEAVVLSTSGDPEATVLTHDLVAGGYVVALRPDFVLSRVDASGQLVPVESRLLSEAVQPVQITTNTTTRVTYRFAVPGGEVSFGTGELEIGIEVTAVGADCRPPEGATPVIGLEPVAVGLSEPVFVAAAPGDDERLFLVEKGGTIRVSFDGVLQDEPFLDLREHVINQGELGLLGLAFQPDYADSGRFYVFFSSNGGLGVPSGTSVVARLEVDPFDRSVANSATLEPLLTVEKPAQNHNGGTLAFGPDGFLYIGLGDGGGANDQHGTIGNGQALDTLLGKLLRIDVKGGGGGAAYGIPPGNLAEVTGLAALPEIWAYGVRNPWRFGFDPCNGDLYIGDVGQNTLEEIDYLPGGTPAGTNFGWRLMEGTICRPGGVACDPAGLTLPVDTYGRDVGASVTGGYVYRGSALPGLRGRYLYADFVSGAAFSFRIESGAVADRQDISAQLRSDDVDFGGISSFGQDNAGELYVASLYSGAVYRVVAAP